MKALTASWVVLSLACGPAVQRSQTADVPAGTVVITAEQIEKSGARTAWQALKQHAPMLQTTEDRNGHPTSLGRRGRASFYLHEAPVVLVDGVRITDFQSLEDIAAQTILAIYIYDGIEGTTQYGTNSVSGVILIKTKDGREQPSSLPHPSRATDPSSL